MVLLHKVMEWNPSQTVHPKTLSSLRIANFVWLQVSWFIDSRYQDFIPWSNPFRQLCCPGSSEHTRAPSAAWTGELREPRPSLRRSTSMVTEDVPSEFLPLRCSSKELLLVCNLFQNVPLNTLHLNTAMQTSIHLNISMVNHENSNTSPYQLSGGCRAVGKLP